MFAHFSMMMRSLVSAIAVRDFTSALTAKGRTNFFSATELLRRWRWLNVYDQAWLVQFENHAVFGYIADNLSSFAWSSRFLILVFSSFAILFSSQIGAFDFARLNLLFLEIKLAQHSWGSSVAFWTLKRARHLFFFPSKSFNERPSKEEVEWWAEPFSDATSSWSSLRIFADFIWRCCLLPRVQWSFSIIDLSSWAARTSNPRESSEVTLNEPM